LFILAIIPAFNEEKSISNVVQRTIKYVDRVIVIDDSSKDSTPELAQEAGATVLRHPKNGGVGTAMKTGVQYAQKLRPDIVVTLDADGQHKPEDIPRLIRPILMGRADLVLGSRFLRGPQRNVPLIKRLGNKVLTLLTGILVGAKLTDTQTGFRALNQKALLALNLRGGYTYVQEMIIVLCLRGYQLTEVPIYVMPREHGTSRVALNILKYAAKSLATIFYVYIQQKCSVGR